MVVPKVKFYILKGNKYLNFFKKERKKENKKNGEKLNYRCMKNKSLVHKDILWFDALTVNIWGQFLRFSHENGVNNSSVH